MNSCRAYDEIDPEPVGVRLHHLLDDPLYLVSARRGRTLAALRDATWIAGCDRCRGHLLSLCADEGFEPRIGYTSDDTVVMQELVAAGLGVATMPGLALRAHRAEGIVASELPARSDTSTPRPTASRPTRPPPPPCWRPSPRPPRRRRRRRSPERPRPARPRSAAARSFSPAGIWA